MANVNLHVLPTLLAQQDVLNPSGKNAADAAWLLALLIGTATFVVVVVTVLVLVSVVRSRRSVDAQNGVTDHLSEDDERGVGLASPATAMTEAHPRERAGMSLVIFAGLVFPIVVLTAVFALTLGPLNRFTRHARDAVRVTVTGHRWWWEVEYASESQNAGEPTDTSVTGGADSDGTRSRDAEMVRTANEVHIPVDTDVLLRLRSDDVIHSFWVPELSGKIDMVPGKVNNLTLHATRTGTFTGKCAEFCGIQHTRMRFQVVVETEDDYRTWLERMRTPPKEPTGAALRGRQIFLGSACVYCHAIEGTNASSRLGPDLTHLASRKTLAAGTSSNTRGALAGWILDPQSMKPGNLMPPMDIPGDQLQDLLAYLETLE